MGELDVLLSVLLVATVVQQQVGEAATLPRNSLVACVANARRGQRSEVWNKVSLLA